MRSYSTFRKALVLSGAVGLALSLSHCGQAPTSTPASGTFTAVYQSMQNANCLTCHSPAKLGTANGSSLDLTSQTTAYATLVGATVTGGVSKGTCGSVNLVAASNPSTSYLLATLFTQYDTSNFGVTGCTPFSHNSGGNGTANFSDSDKASFVAWVQNGAQNN